MFPRFYLSIILSLSSLSPLCAEASVAPTVNSKSITDRCHEILAQIPRSKKAKLVFERFCRESVQMDACTSSNGLPILHWDKAAKGPESKRILVFGMFHGDEPISGLLPFIWIERLYSVEPRNQWRFIPVLNPDGLFRRTRTNARGVDLNRNFPTLGWEKDASKWWERSAKRHPQKFPGHTPASEAEVKCAMSEIEEFKPDLVVSVHAPYGVLDFDGPRLLREPSYRKLRWKPLGNYPGSLGRFLWRDRKIPVLTVELYGGMLPEELNEYALLQDVIGGVALQSGK